MRKLKLPRLPAPPRLKDALRTLAIVVVLFAARSSLASTYVVPTGSMKPTIEPGDRFIATKAAYGLRLPFTSVWITGPHAPARGDIVVFESPNDPSIDLVKRVAAVAGERVEVRPGEALVVPEGHFFALGDNRASSLDSRFFGPVPLTKLRGRARVLVFRAM